MDAFNVVQGWVRAGAAGDSTALVRVGAASVAVRVDGVLVGRGTAAQEKEADGPAVRVAAERAIAEARSRAPRGSDALQQESAADFWRRATVSLELAGPLVPLDVATYDEVDAEVRPGIEGVGARVGSRLELMFPGAMLVRSIGPGDALASVICLAAEEPALALREDPEGQPAKVRQKRDLRCYRFRTVHIAGAAPESPGIFLDRGARLVGGGWPRSVGEIREWAEQMARHIVGRRRVVDGVPEYGGVYLPVAGKFDEPGASALEEILAARAMLMVARDRGARPETSSAARVATLEIADAVARRRKGERSADDDAPSAALWACLLPQLVVERDAPGTPDDETTWPPEWAASYRGAVAALAQAGGQIGDVPPAQRAVVAFALARRAGERWAGVGEGAVGGARAALDSLYAQAAPGQLATFMPWLGWGELAMKADPIPAGAALREMRTTVYAHQLRPEGLAPDNMDMAGGIVFTGARSPLPTWQTARVAAFLASAVGDRRLTDAGERASEMYRLSATLRFLRQLTADEAGGFMYAEPERARGGVRAALWDQRMPLEATALSLIAACEAVRAVEGGDGGR